MKTDIDLTTFQNSASLSSAHQGSALVEPPRRFVTRYVLPLGLIAAFMAVGAYAVRDSLTPTTDVKVILPVPTTEAAGDPATASDAASGAGGVPLFQAPGWVEPFPYTTYISSLSEGIIDKVHVLEGQEISSGTVVAELIDTEARNEVALAEANLARKKAELESAQESWDNPIALREAVSAAEAEQVRLEAEKANATQMLEVARSESRIEETLTRSGGTGKLPAQKAAAAARSASLLIQEINAKIKANAVTLASAKERLRLRIEDKQRLAIAQAELRNAEVELDQARYQLTQRKVRANTSGTVMRLYASPGSMVSMDMDHGMRVAAIYDPQKLQVRAEVPMADAAKIRQDLPAEIRFESLPERVFKGKISRVVHEADVQRNTLPIKVTIEDPDPAIKPEMIARLQFISSPAEGGSDSATTESETVAVSNGRMTGVLIPATIAPEDAKEAKLWVVSANLTAHQRTVQLGPKRSDGLRPVLAGLSVPDKVIATNTDKLKEGSRIRIVDTE